MKILILALFVGITSLMAQNVTINMYGNEKENISFDLDMQFDKVGNLKPYQYFDIKKINSIESLKIITTPGLKATVNNEKEIFIYYKDSNNTYRMGQGRIYTNENDVKILMDPENWKFINFHLNYYNVTDYKILNDLDNERNTKKWKVLGAN